MKHGAPPKSTFPRFINTWYACIICMKHDTGSSFKVVQIQYSLGFLSPVRPVPRKDGSIKMIKVCNAAKLTGKRNFGVSAIG